MTPPRRRKPRSTNPHAMGIDFTDVEILRALSRGKMSLREIGEHLGFGVSAGGGCGGCGGVSPQFIVFRLKRMAARGWVVVARMPGAGNGSRKTRTLTRAGRMALKRFG